MQLKILSTQGAVDVWHDRRIQPGSEWSVAIERELHRADVVMILLSAAALASDYICSVEVETALRRHRAKECVVVPIVLERCLWKETPLGEIQAIPTDGKPIRDWKPQGNAWHNVAEHLKGLLADLKSLKRTDVISEE